MAYLHKFVIITLHQDRCSNAFACLNQAIIDALPKTVKGYLMILVKPGDRYGRLTIVSETERHITPRGKFRRVFTCICDCGVTKNIQLCDLTAGNTKSCGCLNIENHTKRLTKHGLYGTPEYRSYRHIRNRCLNPKVPAYPSYGGRGITICDRWLESFENFFADMGEKPSPKHSIERIDNDKGYSPDNCKWADDIEQANNKRNNRLIKYNGEIKTLAQWAEILGIKRQTITSRLRSGWSDEKIIATPVMTNKIT
jgi:hypothetical protein